MDQSHFQTVVSAKLVDPGDWLDVFRPDGSLLFKFCRGALAQEVCDHSKASLRRAAGGPNEHRRGLCSSVIGYYDLPEPHVTPFTRDYPAHYAKCLAFIRECDRVFRQRLPARYKVQRKVVESTDRRWVIANTVFSTITVNRWSPKHHGRFYIHKDERDLRAGFGVLSAISAGDYEGGFLVFPKYGVAVDVRTTDVLLYDRHEAHANAPIVGEEWERISVIPYFVSDMQDHKK